MKFFFFLLAFSVFTATAQDSIEARIVLVGDAGQLTNGRQPVVDAVRNTILLNKNTTVLFLGDNLYEEGLPDNTLPTYATAKAPLDSQITITAGTEAKAFFIPGNHDWSNGASNGFISILREQSYFDILANKSVVMQPRDGCPGPVEAKISGNIVLIMLDSQWWLQQSDRPGIESDCPAKTEEEVIVQLEDLIQKNSDKLIILATHHPFKSYGPHGGYFTIKQHIFPFTDINPKYYIPLPVIGSIYPLTRAVFGTSQDLKHPLYQKMINSIENVTNQFKNVIYVSGHEHTLQYIVDSLRPYIVSGSGSKSNRVSKGKNSLFASSKNGFAVLEITKSKNVYTKFYEIEGDSVKESFDDFVMNFSKEPIKVDDTLRIVEYAFKDSVKISASDKFKNWNGFKRTFLGTNYRKEWNTPISLKEFNIRKEKGGFTIKSLGGGKQTKSLKLIDKNGKEWSLRTVEKDPEKALPANLRGTIAQQILSDMISASYPYAPLVVDDLAKAVGVISARPEFFFVPDDPTLGYYRPLFANQVCMLEDRDPTVKDGTDNSKSTGKVINKMLADNDHHIDQEKVLTARLLDMVIGDFDRHADQWKWGTGDTGKGKLYYPIPRDRDQAFFRSNGWLVKYLSSSNMGFLEGFNKKIKDINSLNYVARDFDRIFLNNLDFQAWDSITKKFQSDLTDETIYNSVKNLPPEIQVLDSANIAAKLIARRDGIYKNAIKYYKFISKAVNVTGSNENELFHITSSPNGLLLSVYKKNDKSDSATVMYKRSFQDKVTKEIRLYGLNGDDKFVIDEDVKSGIKVRIIGGKGNDTFDLKGNNRSFLYDLSQEKNVILNTKKTKSEFSKDVSVIEYKPSGFQYNKFLFPQLNFGYNTEDGILVGVGFTSTTYGFRKDPYSTNQKLTTLFAPNNSAYQAKYVGTFNHVISKNDLILKGEIYNPTLNSFYGFGNSSPINKELSSHYYRARFKYLSGSVLIRKRINDIISFSAGPTYQQYWAEREDNKNRIIADPAVFVGDSASIYKVKSYLGGTANLNVDYVNNTNNPSRGITWYSKFEALNGINSNSKAISKISSDMTVYASVLDPSKIGAVIRLGGGHIFSKNFEYFQAMNLGSNNFLRGYNKNRFSGRSMAYSGFELRVKLFKSKSYILPGTVGMLGFYDVGRVWMDKENSDKWHNSYGGGFYYFPYDVFRVSAIIAYSPEGNMFNFTIGTKFNLTF